VPPANPYMTPEAEALLAAAAQVEALPPPAPARKAKPAPTVEAEEAEEAVSEYPKVFYNPRVIDERFRVIGSPYNKRFVQGRFVAEDANDEASVRGALRAWGVDKADRWCGEDRTQEWVCKKCGFRTFLDQAKYDHEYIHGH
jgi:hypothetical protein